MSFSLNQNQEFLPRRSEFMFLKLPLSIIGELVRRKKELVVVTFKFGIFVYPNHRILFHCLRTNFVLSFNQSYPCWVMYCIGQNWCFLSSLKLGTNPSQEGSSPGMMEKFYWLNELKIAWWGRWRWACFVFVLYCWHGLGARDKIHYFVWPLFVKVVAIKTLCRFFSFLNLGLAENIID